MSSPPLTCTLFLAAACWFDPGSSLAAGSGSDVPAPAALEQALREAIEASCPKLAFTFDPDLSRASRAYTEAAVAGRAELSGQALAFVASLETYDPSPVAGLATTDMPAHADRAVSDLFPKSCRFDHVGVAAARLSEKKAVVAVLASTRAIELAFIAGRVDELAQVKLEGRLLQPLAAPRLYHLKPNGSVEEQPLIPLPNGRFSLSVRLVETGEHALEILADGGGGPQVVSLRRVFVGIEPPRQMPGTVAPAGGGNSLQEGLTSVELAISALRRTRGLPQLQRDPALDAVAEQHSRTMAKTRQFAHILPQDGALSDRLVKAGYAHRSAGENIGLAEDAPAAHEAIAQSPAHLANLLDPRHRRLGLGAVSGLSPDGNTSIYLTEVLASPVIGSADPASDVMKALAAERKKRNLPALERDAKLDAIASAEARTIALAGGPAQVRAGIAEKVLDSVPDLMSAAADLVVAGAPEECLTSKNVGEPGWARVGVGALYASSQKYGPGRLWVMLIYAR